MENTRIRLGNAHCIGHEQPALIHMRFNAERIDLVRLMFDWPIRNHTNIAALGTQRME
ncbi:hypothetical protein D3C84_1291630 [compost metagenome]